MGASSHCRRASRGDSPELAGSARKIRRKNNAEPSSRPDNQPGYRRRRRALRGTPAAAKGKAPIKIGNTMPYSGPASSYGVIGRTESTFFKMVNEHGGVDGHMIDFISLDDGYSPPKTVEQIRRLVEQDHVAFTFQTLGTPTNSAVAAYMNHHKVPQLFVGSGASKWSDYKKYPWTMGWQPNYRTEGQIYAKYILKEVKNPKIGILYQNDDFGKDYPNGVRDILGKDWDKLVVKSLTYETTDPTVDSPDRRVAGRRSERAGRGRHPEVRRAGDPQDIPDGLETDILHDQRVDLGGRRDWNRPERTTRSVC